MRCKATLLAAVTAAVVLVSASAAQAAVVTDTFTGTNGTLLESHTGEVGATWGWHPNYAADLKLQNNKVWGPEWGLYFASGIPSTNEYDVTADLTVMSNAGAIGVTGRTSTSGSDDLYMARYNAGSVRWELVKCGGGACTNLGFFNQTLAIGSTYAVKLEIRNAAKKLFVDGVERVSSTDNTITQVGRAGIRTGPGVTTASTGYHLDNFNVNPPPTAETTITAGPSGATNNTSPSFSFTSTPSGGTFECMLTTNGVNGSWAACTTPKAYSGLVNGSSYVFNVRATVGGVTDSTPATRSFNVDTAAPNTTISGGPSGATNNTAPSFTFTSTEPTGATYECMLTTNGVAGSWGPCSSPKAYSGLVNGSSYVFNVRARDAAGNQDATPDTRSFTVDTSAPTATITSGPSGTITVDNASFGFSSEAGATFECMLTTNGVNGSWGACTSPKSYTGLANNPYVFNVRARDAAGNTGAAATRSFTVAVPSGVTCHVTASPGGAISTKAGLYSALSAGQTGCFRAGTYGAASDADWNLNKANITIRSYPGETATIKGRIVLQSGADGAALRELRLDGWNLAGDGTYDPSPTIDGPTDVVIADNDISNQEPNPSPTLTRGSICVHPTNWAGTAPNGFVVERNRIHNCGELPFTNHHHGIYIDGVTSGTVRNNVIYDNADRGISLHYDPANVQIYNNTIDGNGRGLHFGDGSTNNLAQRNVITNSIASSTGYNLTRYNLGTGNSVVDTCLKEGNPNGFDTDGGIEPGFTNSVSLGFWVDSDAQDPYVNRGAKDFRLAAGSVCAGRGWGAPDDVAQP